LEILRGASQRSERVLFGIDHQWSWPLDLWRVAGIEGPEWRHRLECLVRGEGGRPPLGPPAVFPAAFNVFARRAVFHCRVRNLARSYGLPTLSDWEGDPIRLTEWAMPGAKPATRLGGPGAVAGQTLLGLKALASLLKDARTSGVDVLAWPFDALQDDGRSHVGVEVYPSFYRGKGVPKADDADARACCEWSDRADLKRALDLTAAPPEIRAAARIEGWILGADPDFQCEPGGRFRGMPRGGRRLARTRASLPKRSERVSCKRSAGDASGVKSGSWASFPKPEA
jgi:hypothetical protein